MRSRTRFSSRWFRNLALASPLVLASLATAAPSALDSTSPRAESPSVAHGGAYSVNARTGTATYAFPFTLPPERAVGPALGLVYSSNAPIRGEVAEGWSLGPLPAIRRDVRREKNGSDRAYTADMGGNRHDLAYAAGDITAYGGRPYRARVDHDFTRYELVNSVDTQTWYAFTVDGRAFTFAQMMPGDWRVTTVVDRWGNQVDYAYEPVGLGGRTVDYALTSISYTRNLAAGLAPYARVELVYDRSPARCLWNTQPTALPLPVGAAVSYATGSLRVTGVWKLTDVRTKVFENNQWREVRHWQLYYDEQNANTTLCYGSNSPRRTLQQIVDLQGGPGAYFGYGALPYTTPTVETPYRDTRVTRKCNGDAQTPPGTLSLPADVDGDGKLENLVGNCTSEPCYARAGASTYPLPSAGGQYIIGTLPHPGANLDGAWGLYGTSPSIRFAHLDYRWIDVDGDGKLDLVVGGAWAPQARPAIPPQTAARCTAPACATNSQWCSNRGDCAQAWAGSFNGFEPSNSSSIADSVLRCNGGYLWQVYHNLGGSFGAPETWCAPVAVAGQPVGPNQPYPPGASYLFDYRDMNGDGIPDLVSASFSSAGGNSFGPYQRCPLAGARMMLNVFYGDGHGNFTDGEPWTAPAWPVACRDDEPMWNLLVDVNGDGLPDLVHETQATDSSRYQTLYVAYNRGHGFDPQSVVLLQNAPDLFPRRDIPLDDCRNAHGNFLKDVDGDGLVDLACVDQQQCSGIGYGVAFGLGSGFAPLTTTGDDYRQVRYGGGANDVVTIGRSGQVWQLENDQNGTTYKGTIQDYADFSGDGIPERYRYGTNNFVIDTWTPPREGGPGLLTDVTTAAGARIRFHYAHSTDTHVVTVNSARPPYAQGWNDWIPPSLAYAGWVIKQVDVDDNNGHVSTVGYAYADPVVLQDGSGAGSAPGASRRFRGFESVTTTLPLLAGETQAPKIFERYSYAVDPDGLLDYRTSKVFSASAPNGIKQAIDRATYVAKTILDPSLGIRFVHTDSSTHIECVESTVENACDAQSRFRTITSYTFTSPDSRIWLPESVGAATTSVDNRQISRQVWTNFLVLDSARDYLVLPKRRTTVGSDLPPPLPPPGGGGGGSQLVSAALLQAPNGKEEFFYDGSNSVDACGTAFGACRGALTKHRTYRNPSAMQVNDASCVDPNVCNDRGFAYDGQVGVVVRELKPSDMRAANGNAQGTSIATVSHSYDANRLFPTSTWNALGHQTWQTFDLGTGNILTISGPNWKAPPPPPGCSLCFSLPVYEWRAFTYDAIGRLRTEAFPRDTATGYTAEVIHRIDYTGFTQVDEYSAVDWSGQATPQKWAATRTLYDGLGRVKQSMVSPGGSRFDVAGVATTAYDYDVRGQPIRVTRPSPADDSATVTEAIRYDGRGRVIEAIAPDSLSTVISYTPWERIVRDAENKTRHEAYDGFGQLRTVDEGGGAEVAHTTYEFDGAGRLARIVDADARETRLAHDGEGHRYAVTRQGGRTWSLDYDRDGQISRRVDPDGRTTTYTYDSIGRLVEESPDAKLDPDPVRAASLARWLGIGRVRYIYDGATEEDPAGVSLRNRRGRLAAVQLFVPAAGGKPEARYAAVTYGYDVMGRAETENWKLDWIGAAPNNRSFLMRRAFGPVGQPQTITYPNGQVVSWNYDERGQVQSLVGAGQTLAQFQYYRAGQVRTRQSLGGTSTPLQAHTYQYDVRGQLHQDALTIGAQTLTRGYDYSPDGDAAVEHIDDRLADGTLQRNFTYQYDSLRRLATANITGTSGGSLPLSYSADLHYTPAGNVSMATVVGALGLPQRNGVGYQYDASGVTADVQAVTALVQGTSHIADFTYDHSGNLVDRNVYGWGGLYTHYVYDTNDQIRQVTNGQGGSEQYFYLGKRRFLSISGDTVSWRFYLGNDFELDYTAGGTEQQSIFAGGVARITQPTYCPSGCAPQVTILHHDRRGDLVAAVDANGTLRAHLVYGAFGEILYKNDPTNDWRRRFNEAEQDQVDGLSYYGHRFYDPLTLRWTTQDPLYRFLPDAGLGAAQRQNLYHFTRNNPLAYIDPNGLDSDRTGSSWTDGLGFLGFGLGWLLGELLDGGDSGKASPPQKGPQFKPLPQQRAIGGWDRKGWQQAYDRSELLRSVPFSGILPDWIDFCYDLDAKVPVVADHPVASGFVIAPSVFLLGTGLGVLYGAATGTLVVGTGGTVAAGTGTVLAPGLPKLANAAQQVLPHFAPGRWLDHFQKHVVEELEFRGFGYENAMQYLEGARRFFANPNVMTFLRGNGDRLFYRFMTNEFGVLTANNIIRTYFQPSEGLWYYLRQIPGF